MEGQERRAKIKDTNKSKHKKTEPKKCSRKDYKQKILEWTGVTSLIFPIYNVIKVKQAISNYK